jgi:hypothetical protein
MKLIKPRKRDNVDCSKTTKIEDATSVLRDLINKDLTTSASHYTHEQNKADNIKGSLILGLLAVPPLIYAGLPQSSRAQNILLPLAFALAGLSAILMRLTFDKTARLHYDRLAHYTQCLNNEDWEEVYSKEEQWQYDWVKINKNYEKPANAMAIFSFVCLVVAMLA